MNKRFGLPLLILLLSIPISVIAKEPATLSLESAINKAGRLRMLSQRIVLKYSQTGQALFPGDARIELNWDLALFATEVEELNRFVSQPLAREAVSTISSHWKHLEDRLKAKADPQRLREVNYIAEDLLYFANKLTAILQEVEDLPVHRLVNRAGKQRMLSQRLAKLYLLRSQGVSSLYLEDQFTQAAEDFHQGLELLRRAPETDNSTRELLDSAIVQWTWFNNVIQLDDEGEDYRLIVVDSANELLELFDRITLRYAAVESEQ